MTVVNVNYRGRILEGMEHFHFRVAPPQMATVGVEADFNDELTTTTTASTIPLLIGERTKLVVFRNGKCRLMGCRRLSSSSLRSTQIVRIRIRGCNAPVKVQLLNVISATATFTLDSGAVILKQLSDYCYAKKIKFVYEPELFPALRLSSYNPLCVNVFSSGRCVILGIRSLDAITEIISSVSRFINSTRYPQSQQTQQQQQQR
jgi:TATA-box binding protein (TBP) (component of TFIID and TFIIIB)